MPRWLAVVLAIVGVLVMAFPIVLIGDRGGGATRTFMAIGSGSVGLALLGLLSPTWPPTLWRRLPLPVRIVLTLGLVGAVLASVLFVALFFLVNFIIN
jgi:hypothetical protein